MHILVITTKQTICAYLHNFLSAGSTISVLREDNDKVVVRMLVQQWRNMIDDFCPAARLLAIALSPKFCRILLLAALGRAAIAKDPSVTTLCYVLSRTNLV